MSKVIKKGLKKKREAKIREINVRSFNAEGNRTLGNGVRKNGVRNRVRIDDAGSILKFSIGFPFGENSAWFCKFVWIPGSILNFLIGSVSSKGGLIAATLFAATISDSQKEYGWNNSPAKATADSKDDANALSSERTSKTTVRTSKTTKVLCLTMPMKMETSPRDADDPTTWRNPSAYKVLLQRKWSCKSRGTLRGIPAPPGFCDGLSSKTPGFVYLQNCQWLCSCACVREVARLLDLLCIDTCLVHSFAGSLTCFSHYFTSAIFDHSCTRDAFSDLDWESPKPNTSKWHLSAHGDV